MFKHLDRRKITGGRDAGEQRVQISRGQVIEVFIEMSPASQSILLRASFVWKKLMTKLPLEPF